MQTGERPAAAHGAEEESNNSAISGGQTVRANAFCMILVVDDNIINRQVAVQTLQKLGCVVEAAEAACDAVDLHARRRYDLVLMDCQMPGLDGYQAASLIRAMEAGTRPTPIIGWTSTLGAGERRKCIEAGMDDVMAKPISRDAAYEMILRWMTRPISLQLPGDNTIKNYLAEKRQRFGSDYAELAALFQIDSRSRIDAMREAASSGDFLKVGVVAHVLAGSCASMGALQLASMCRNLELYCKAANSENLALFLDGIEAKNNEIQANINTLLQSATL